MRQPSLRDLIGALCTPVVLPSELQRRFLTRNSFSMRRIALITFGILASVFSVIGLATCTFIKTTDENFYYDFSNGFGLFAFEVNGECHNYENNRTEGAHTAAQSFSIVSTVALAAAVGCAIVAYHKPIAFRWSTFFFGCALVSSMLTMLMFAAPYKHRVCLEHGDCRPGLGAGLYVANILLLPGLIVLAHSKANQLLKRGDVIPEVPAESKTRDNARESDSEVGDHFSFFSSLASIKSEPMSRQHIFRTDSEDAGGDTSWKNCICLP